MNRNTANELYKKFADAFPSSTISEFNKNYNSSVVFKMPIPEKPDAKDLHDAFINEKLLMPFESVFIIDTTKGLNGEEFVWFFYRINGKIKIYPIWRNENFKVDVLNTLSISESDFFRRYNENNPSITSTFSVIQINPRVEPMQVPDEVAKSSIASTLDSIAYFCLIASCPNHHLVHVSPPKTKQQGRSVEWVNAKSHYIILDSSHAKQINKGGCRDFNGTITKAMHKRRGHIRLLKSDKFIKKKGMRIWINATWVGPKEWEGSDRSVYVVKERENPYKKLL